jgi:hypothetical protein
LTKGTPRRVSSSSSGALWRGGTEQHRLAPQQDAGFALGQHRVGHAARLGGFVGHRVQARAAGRGRSVHSVLSKRSAASAMTALEAASTCGVLR